MKIGRIATPTDRYLVRVEDGTAVPVVREAGEGDDAMRAACEGEVAIEDLPAIAPPVALDACRALSPVAAPRKIVCIGLNYRDHAEEAGLPIPAAPLCFAKTVNTLIGADDEVCCPEPLGTALDYEAEIAVVMRSRARSATPDDALDAVLGYTLCNDVTARDAQFGDGQWFRGKSFDTFLPLGPWVVTGEEVDPGDIEFVCRLNDVVVQKGTTSNMIFDVRHLVSYVSEFLTLEPGDVIATGTPAGVGHTRVPPVYLKDGDVVEVSSEAIGALRNTVSIQQLDRVSRRAT